MTRVLPTATVVVVSRDRWAPAPGALELLLARTDPRHPVVVVAAGVPRRLRAALDRAADPDRVRMVRHTRFLAGNEARNLGADRVRTEWVAFVENDAVLAPGWLDRLLAVAEARDAASAYPVYLQLGSDGLWVHGAGADLEVTGPAGARRLVEHQPFVGRPWRDVRDQMVPAERLQAEPHAFVVRRRFLDAIGGFDEELLGWFDHTDLALQHLHRSAAAWFVPDVTCLYRPPPPLAVADAGSFLLRWGSEWYERSLDRLCATWGLVRDDPAWETHRRFRHDVRIAVPTSHRRGNAALARVSAPVEAWLARRGARGRARAYDAGGAQQTGSSEGSEESTTA